MDNPMGWKVNQWVRCDFAPMRGEGGKVEASHCFYKIRRIQPARKTFTVFCYQYVFSLDDGAVFIGKVKAPLYGRASSLTPEDKKRVDEMLSKHPLAFMLEDSGQVHTW
jgi:hypothetical protein